MKKLALLFLLCQLGMVTYAKECTDSSKLLRVIIMNDNRMRPIAITKEYFWQSRNLNEITFSGSIYFDLVKYKLSNNVKDSVLSDFSISAALIFSENNKSDTLYTDQFFMDWLINEESSVSSDEFLRKMFGSLYLGFYDIMEKGENVNWKKGSD